MKWSEPRRALPAKVSQKAVNTRLAICPLILKLTDPYSSSARSWGKRANLGLLAQPRQGAPFPPTLCRLITLPLCQGSFPFFYVCFLCSWPPSSSCHFCGLGPGLNYSQKMILCTVAHLDRSLIFTVVKVIRFRIKWFYITTSCGLLDCVMGQGWVGSRHTGLASGKRLYVLGNVKMRMKVFK